VLAHFEPEATLLEHGARARRFFASPPDLPLQSLVAVPLRVKPRSIGFIALGRSPAGRRFDEGQRKLLSIIGSRAAAAIENARLYEDLQATFKQTIQGLGAPSTRWTATPRATPIGSRLRGVPGDAPRLSPDEVEIVRQSALMHDIGKIGCVLNLNKPGQAHQRRVRDLQEAPGLRSRHPRADQVPAPADPGRAPAPRALGRPRLSARAQGRDIPLIARIISVADTYDAMTSDRSYRRALPHDVAIAEVERCDPEVSDAFTGLDDYREGERASGREVPE
jgi:hypothetical protein